MDVRAVIHGWVARPIGPGCVSNKKLPDDRYTFQNR